jgi:DHA2 family multidrug resistance protein-like MFS transporter
MAVGVVASLGMAPVFTLATDLIVGTAPPERAGSASGISETSAELGGALGIAVLGSVGTAIYRSRLASALPAGLPSDVVVIARNTLGGAVSVAEQLPGHLGGAVVDVAQSAFVQGLHTTAALSAAIAAVGAVLAILLLRRVPTGQEISPPHGLSTDSHPSTDSHLSTDILRR